MAVKIKRIEGLKGDDLYRLLPGIFEHLMDIDARIKEMGGRDAPAKITNRAKEVVEYAEHAHRIGAASRMAASGEADKGGAAT